MAHRIRLSKRVRLDNVLRDTSQESPPEEPDDDSAFPDEPRLALTRYGYRSDSDGDREADEGTLLRTRDAADG